MRVRILGAHHNESKSTRFVCLVIDGRLALDAGALTSSLSLEEQRRLKAVVITHCHYDHLRDLPALAANLYQGAGQIDLYSTLGSYKNMKVHVFNNILYPRYLKIPPGRPTLVFHKMKQGISTVIEGYDVLPVPVNHNAHSVGYLVSDGRGQKLLFTGDTGPGAASGWRRLSPRVIITELTFPNRLEKSALSMGHLTPNLLNAEMNNFKASEGYLPRLIAVHMNSALETEIREETAVVSGRLGTPITLAAEGMEIDL